MVFSLQVHLIKQTYIHTQTSSCFNTAKIKKHHTNKRKKQKTKTLGLDICKINHI